MANAQLLGFYQTFLTAAGLPLNGGQVFTYVAGTSTPQATYTDQTAATPLSNPVVLNAAGQVSTGIWFRTDLAYKIVVEDSSNNVLATYDNVLITNLVSIDKTKLNSNIAGVALSQNVSTKAFDVQVDNTTIDVNVSNQLELKPGAITPSFFSASSKLEVIAKNSRDLTDPGSIKHIPQYEWTTPTLLSVGTNPPGTSFVAKWSANGEFLAVGSNTTPFIDIYQYSRTGVSFTKLANPGTLPAGAVSYLSWSPCGDFLACAHAISPYLTIYQRSGNAFTKLADPGSLPAPGGGGTLNARGVAFSPNSDFLAASWVQSGGTGSGSAHFIMYERSGTTFTDITSTTGNLNTINSGHGVFRGAWSPDSSLFVTIDNNSGLPIAFQRTDFTFTSITAPVAPYSTNILDFSFSPDGNFLAMQVNVSPWILIFTVSSSGTFTLLTSPITLTNDPLFVNWAANSEYLVLSTSSSPYFLVYQVTNPTTTPTFTLQTAVSSPPSAQINYADWSATKQFLAVCSGTTPYAQVYETASTLPSNALLWTRGIPNV